MLIGVETKQPSRKNLELLKSMQNSIQFVILFFRQAIENKAGIWSKQQPAQKAEDKKGWKPGKELHGKVVEVVSAGVVVVEDGNKNRHRINLSSIRALRGGSLVVSKEEEKKEV